jgi:hypothetical protein
MVNAAFVELVTIISRNWLAIEMRVSYAVADARFPNRADALPTWTHFRKSMSVGSVINSLSGKTTSIARRFGSMDEQAEQPT